MRGRILHIRENFNSEIYGKLQYFLYSPSLQLALCDVGPLHMALSVINIGGQQQKLPSWSYPFLHSSPPGSALNGALRNNSPSILPNLNADLAATINRTSASDPNKENWGAQQWSEPVKSGAERCRAGREGRRTEPSGNHVQQPLLQSSFHRRSNSKTPRGAWGRQPPHHRPRGAATAGEVPVTVCCAVVQQNGEKVMFCLGTCSGWPRWLRIYSWKQDLSGAGKVWWVLSTLCWANTRWVGVVRQTNNTSLPDRSASQRRSGQLSTALRLERSMPLQKHDCWLNTGCVEHRSVLRPNA